MIQFLIAAGSQRNGNPAAVRFCIGMKPGEPHNVAEHVAQDYNRPCVYRISRRSLFMEVQPVAVVLSLVTTERQ